MLLPSSLFIFIKAGTFPSWASEKPQHIVNVTINDQHRAKGKHLSTEEFSVPLLAEN